LIELLQTEFSLLPCGRGFCHSHSWAYPFPENKKAEQTSMINKENPQVFRDLAIPMQNPMKN
jgi:hypothetical protein